MAVSIDNLHIIVVNDFSYVNGGASKVAIASALALSQSGYSVSFFSAVGPVTPELLNSKVDIVCLEQFDILRNPNRFRAVTQGIWNVAAAKAIDALLNKWANYKIIVHIHAFVKALSSSVIKACHKHDVLMVLTLHDYFTACPNGGIYDYQQQRICTRKAMSVDCIRTHCDVRSYSHKLWRVIRHAVQKQIGGIPSSIEHFIYISELSKQLLLPYLPETAKLHYVPNPIDVKRNSRIEAENNHDYIFIGRLSPEKGIDAFCKVLSKLGYSATVIGDGEKLSDLKKEFPLIEFTGWLEKKDIIGIIQKAKALVFPTLWYETQGLVVYESLAQGVPVIVPKHCCAVEGVKHEINGLLYDACNPTGLELVIQQLNSLSYDEIKNISEGAYNNYWNEVNDVNQHINDLITTYSMING